MSLNQITFYKFKKDDMSGVESHNDFVDTTQLFLFPPNLFNIEAYEIDYYYTWVGGAEGDRYTPGTILDPEIDTMPEDGTEFYTAWKEGDRGYLALIYDDITIDISDLLLGANVTYGKNQPFPYGEVTISKQIFNSDDYWASRIEMSLYQGDATPITKKPVLKQGSTRVLIGVYGMEGEWEFQRVKDIETTYNLICVHPAHRLKNIALDSLFTLGPYTQTPDDAYLTFPNLLGEEVFYFRKDGVLSPNCSYVSGTPSMWIVEGFMGSGVDLYIEVGVHKSPTVSKLTGPPSEIFKLLVHLGIGTSYSDMKVDLGTTLIDSNFEFTETVSSDNMDNLKKENKSIETNEYLKNTSIRAQGNMWEVIQSLGHLANCEAFFYDKAYFVDYVTPDTSVDKLLLNYENVPADGWITEEVLNIVDNLDQGSQAIQTSQTVFSENYTTSMAVEGSSKYLIEGTDVKYIYPDTPEEGYVKDRRNFQIKTIALNLLLKNYQPGDVVSYSVSEIKRADVFYDNKEEMEADLVNQSEGIIAQVGVGYFAEYYICTIVGGLTKAWVEFKFNVNPIRGGKYSIYSRANHIKDEQNDLELFDVPLALTTLSYPSCMTTYVWGNPEFLDTEQALKEVESGVADSTKTGTDDTVISDKYSAMMVYGNLSVAEIDEDRNDFTGMILEKNWDTELYQFAGYKNGKVQAKFNTEGKVEAGGGDVIMDEEGLTVLFDKNYEGENYEPQSALKFKCRQDEAWESATLFSSVLNVILPTESEPRKQNLTALITTDGPAIPGDPDRTKTNLLLANSKGGYGPSISKNEIFSEYVPHCVKLEAQSEDEPYMFGEFEKIESSDEDVYIGYNPTIFPPEFFDSESFILPSGVVFEYTITNNAPNQTERNKIRFQTLSFKIGGRTANINFNNQSPTSSTTTGSVVLTGVFECNGPNDIDLVVSNPLNYNVYITSWKIGIFGCMTLRDTHRYISNNLWYVPIIGDRWGGTFSNLSNANLTPIYHNSPHTVSVQLLKNQVLYDRKFIGVGNTLDLELPYSGSYIARCGWNFSPQGNPLSHISWNRYGVTAERITIGGKGSMIFLREDGGHIFGNLSIMGGQHANLSFKQPFLVNGVTDPGGIYLKNSTLRGSYGSDGYPEASALQHIGNMMHVTSLGSVTKNVWRTNTTNHPRYIMLVNSHQNLDVSIADVNSVETQIYRNRDRNNGDGWCTAHFFVPPGWKWKCGGEGTSTVTIFDFVRGEML